MRPNERIIVAIKPAHKNIISIKRIVMKKLMIALVAVTCFAAHVSAQQKLEIAGSQVQKIQSSISTNDRVTGCE